MVEGRETADCLPQHYIFLIVEVTADWRCRPGEAYGHSTGEQIARPVTEP